MNSELEKEGYDIVFHSRVKFSNDQIETDVEATAVFVRSVDARLRQEYPEYTIGTWVHFRAQREMKKRCPIR